MLFTVNTGRHKGHTKNNKHIQVFKQIYLLAKLEVPYKFTKVPDEYIYVTNNCFTLGILCSQTLIQICLHFINFKIGKKAPS